MVYIWASFEEEVGLHGAEMISRRIKPNAAIITDVCHDTQTPMMNKIASGDLSCGNGPVLGYAPAVQNNLLKLIIDTAKKNKIAFQRMAASRSTGTDTDAFAYSADGVASALISLPRAIPLKMNNQDVEDVIMLMYHSLKAMKNNHDFRYIK